MSLWALSEAFFPLCLSLLMHVRHSYRPYTGVVVRDEADHWRIDDPSPGKLAEPGMIMFLVWSSPFLRKGLLLCGRGVQTCRSVTLTRALAGHRRQGRYRDGLLRRPRYRRTPTGFIEARCGSCIGTHDGLKVESGMLLSEEIRSAKKGLSRFSHVETSLEAVQDLDLLASKIVALLEQRQPANARLIRCASVGGCSSGLRVAP